MSQELSRPELPAIGFAAQLSAEDRRVLSGYGEFLPVQAEQNLITEGAEQDSLYFILSGRFHVTTEQEGRRILLGRLGRGDVVGEVNVFDPESASATVTALEFSQVWRIDRPMIEDFLKDDPASVAFLLLHISIQLSKRLRETNEKVAFIRKTVSNASYL